ncbi:MAG TPA: FecR domain-containing protein [Rhizomicrobium sp.]|nr:FecR domain-containing protein [Rhizomicrobium sp.]
MSDLKPLSSSASRADAINAQAAAWLEKADFGELNEIDEGALEAWLAESHSHRAAYWRLKAVWQESYRLSVLQRRNASDVARPSIWKTPTLLLRLAAALVVMVVLSTGALVALKSPQTRTYETPIGGHETVRFSDGTQIELNTNTVLRAQMTTQERTVWLEKGEAYFEVRHDPARPMNVIVGARRITDLGTQFLVHRESGQVKVALLEGRVRIGATNLAPGDEAIATATSISVSRKSVEDLTNEIAWRNGVLAFRHATLADAAKAFNRYNAIKLVLADQDVAHQTIGGTFRTNDVQGFGAAVKSLLGLHVVNEGNQIVISR